MEQQINSIQQYVNSILSLINAANPQEQEQYKEEIVETQKALCIELWSTHSYSQNAKMPKIKSADEIDLQKIFHRRSRPSASAGGWCDGDKEAITEARRRHEESATEIIYHNSIIESSLRILFRRFNKLGINIDENQAISFNEYIDDDVIEYISQQIESTVNFAEKMMQRDRTLEHNTEKVLQKKSAPISVKPAYIKSGYTDDELRIIFKNLSELRYISPDSKEDDFVYYFSGNGNAPSSRIIWQGQEQKIFALFLDQMCIMYSRMPWKKLIPIFDGINTESTRQNLQAQYNSKSMNRNKEIVTNRIFNGINIKEKHLRQV